MLMALILLFIGFVGIFLEFFLPGSILATIGGLFVLAAVFVFATETGSLFGTLLFIVGSLVGIALVIKFALWRIRYGTHGHSLYLKKDQQGYFASSWDHTLIGKQGEVSTDLKPGGHILIDGQKHAAISKSGYLVKGEIVVVIDGEGDSLIVKKQNEE